jgi:translation initiation factor 3 subunit G
MGRSSWPWSGRSNTRVAPPPLPPPPPTPTRSPHPPARPPPNTTPLQNTQITAERKAWKRFGAAARETAQDSVTVQGVEEIPFERVRQAKATQQEKKGFTDMQAALQSGADKQQIVGSLKDMLYRRRMERELLRAKGLLDDAERPPGEDGEGGGMPGGRGGPGGGPGGGGLGGGGPPKAGAYVPPSVRTRAGGDAGPGGPPGIHDRRRDDNSLRVSNLSDDVSEADLAELFRPFGPVSRVFLAVDRNTGENRGFAFVTYHAREDAERAMATLNGYGYDNLILSVQWAQAKEPRPY